MLHRLSLAEMLSLVRSESVSSVELVEAHLARIEGRNPHLNAFTMVLAEQARESARRADQGLRIGPLAGIPVTVKDCFDVAGLPTRVGSYFTPDTPAMEDSAVVARLRRAGAIILGKTNTPDFASSYETDNLSRGAPTIRGTWSVHRADRAVARRRRLRVAALRAEWAAIAEGPSVYPRTSAGSRG